MNKEVEDKYGRNEFSVEQLSSMLNSDSPEKSN